MCAIVPTFGKMLSHSSKQIELSTLFVICDVDDGVVVHDVVNVVVDGVVRAQNLS